MAPRLLALLVCLLAGAAAHAAPTVTVATLPGSPAPGDFYWVTDASAPGSDPSGWDCDSVGSPATPVLCAWDGAAWVALQKGGTQPPGVDPEILIEAPRVGYTPADATDWPSPPPDRISEAIDLLAGDKRPLTVSVCPSGCDAQVVCGTDCTDPTTAMDDQCDPGSGVALLRAMREAVPSPTWINFHVKGGDYTDECVSVNSRGAASGGTPLAMDYINITVDRSAYFHPFVDSPLDVAGGVWRFANQSSIGSDEPRVEHINLVWNGTCQNDASSAPEACIQVGRESGSTDPAGYTWDHFDIEINGVVAGLHDGLQFMCARGAATSVPRARVHGTGLVVSANDPLAMKGSCGIPDVVGLHRKLWTNYVEDDDSTFLGVVAGTVASGTSSTVFTLDAADNYGEVNGYSYRTVTLTDNGGGCAAAGKSVVATSDAGANTVTVVTPFAATPGAGCDYSISAVPNWEQSPIRQTLAWRQIQAQDGTTRFWKKGGDHFGTSATNTPSTKDIFRSIGGSIEMILNDASLGGTASCSTASSAGLYCVTNYTQKYRDAIYDGTPCTVRVNVDLQPMTGCSVPVGGLGLIGSGDWLGKLIFRNAPITVVNSADPELATFGVVNASTVGTRNIQLENVQIDRQNTVGGYAARTADTYIESTNTISFAGPVTSPNGMVQRCQLQADGGGTVFADVPVRNLNDANGPRVVAAAACSCQGACGAAQTSVIDSAAGPIGTINCTTNNEELNFVSTIADPQSVLAAGEEPRWDSGTLSGTPGDDVILCVQMSQGP